MSNQFKVLRSLMFVPGHNEKLIDSASKSNADVILFDLEDSVQPPSNKPLARRLIIKKSQLRVFDKYLKFVRVNEISSSYFLQDILQLTEANINGFLLSKTNTAEDIIYLDNLLSSIELERNLEQGKFKLIPILESAASITNIKEISLSSKRIIALGFGSEDFVSDIQGVRDFDENMSISYPRSMVPVFARAIGVEAIDAAYIKVHDTEWLKEHTRIGKILGYSGMWVLHPKQNEIVNEVYSPTEQEFLDAKEFLELYERAKLENKGVAIIAGKFVGPPLITKSKDIIEKVQLIRSK